MNSKIRSEISSIKENLNWNSNKNAKYNISYFSNYGSYNYISVQLTGSSYDRNTKKTINIQKNLNFDLKTGNLIELSDLLGMSLEEYKEKFTSLIKDNKDATIESTESFEFLLKEPQFMISSTSLVLYFEKGEYGFNEKYPVYIYIKHNELKDLLDFRSLYK